MKSFVGTIFKVGKSTTGIEYSETVLKKAVEDFNSSHKGVGVIGHISKVYPPPFYVTDFKYISHTLDSLEFKDGKIITNITFLQNPVGQQLVHLFKNVPDKIKICPIVHGDLEKNCATSLSIDRVDFYYSTILRK